MFNCIVSNAYQYVEPFNFIGSCLIELLEIELFGHLTECIYKMCLQIIYLTYV